MAKATTTKKSNTSKSTAKSSAKKKNPEPMQREASTINVGRRVTEIIIIAILFVCILVSFFGDEGIIVTQTKTISLGLLGWGYYLLAPCLFFMAIFLIPTAGNLRWTGLKMTSLILLPIFFAAFINVLTYQEVSGTISEVCTRLYESGQELRSGGAVAGLLAYLLISLLSRMGAGIILFAGLTITLFLSVWSPDQIQSMVNREPKSDRGWRDEEPVKMRTTGRGNRTAVSLELEEEKSDRSPKSADRSSKTRGTQRATRNVQRETAQYDDYDDETLLPVTRQMSGARKKSSGAAAVSAIDIPLSDDDNERIWNTVTEIEQENARLVRSPQSAARRTETAATKTRSTQRTTRKAQCETAASSQPLTPNSQPLTTNPNAVTLGKTATAADVKDTEPEKITKEDIQKETKAVAEAISREAEKDAGTYVYPEISLLKQSKSLGQDSDAEVLDNKERLEDALHSFGVNSDVINITRGPTVTRFDIKLEQGVKLSKVTNLEGDLALALGVMTVRIAPIPGEISTVGIEVPNRIVNTVTLREIIDSDNFRNAKSKISFAIGKDIGGEAVVGNIAKLPHMLIAGTTGSGKSVCMNSLIISLLYKARPDELKFIMIDPKMVELGIYNAIPHLYVPVVTEPKKAAGALQWAVVEMLKRYRLFSEAGVREITAYNSKCKENDEPTLPYIVIVIDELADLMMAASKEVEESICRVAQMGRAAGMHLIIATQRPSADVITGLMKANIPSRIAFAVSSGLESRIILDQTGAENLVGNGDMLYSPVGIGKPRRIQGAFVSDEERDDIIRFISEHTDIEAVKNDEIQQFMDKAAESKNTDSGSGSSSADSGKSDGTIAGEYDEVLPQAAEVVLEMKSCSVSMLQRRLKLGYSRAARVVDQLEELGIVGPYEGAKPRQVVITREDWNALQVKLGIASEDDFAMAAEMNEEISPQTADVRPQFEDEEELLISED